MNWKPTQIGAEPRKLAILGVLLAAAAYFFISNRNSGSPAAPVRPTAATAPVPSGQKVTVRPVSRPPIRVTQSGLGKNPKEFRPAFTRKDFEPSSVDPTLHLTLLARLQDIKVDGTGRSLFEISAAPPVTIAVKEPNKIPVKAAVGPMPPPPPPPPPPDPKAPPIPLKFYGFVNPARPSVKRAFFLRGDEIVIAGEGDLIEKRYKIVRIGVNSALVEDTQFKGVNTQQTLPLETEMAG